MVKDEIFFMGRKITEGTVIPAGVENVTLPLKYTEVRANIIGNLADVQVIQKFRNTIRKNIEAIYVFPLPHESAVNEFEIKIDRRIIKAEVKEREEARKTYEEARNEGKKAGLLEQERSNIFIMSVANIEPEQDIEVTLRYYETIKYEDGEYEFIFPMTITPRYEESKDNVPHSFTGEISGREVNIFVNLNTGFPIGEIKSPGHLLFIRENGENIREVQLAKEGELPNKDFVLKYTSRGEKPETSLSFYRKEGKAGTFILHLTPKFDYGPEEMLKREMIFVIDRSGSMAIGPMEQAKSALKSCLRTLRTGDSFNIITFDTAIEQFSKTSLEFNEENLKKAEIFINAIRSRGGTDIYKAMNCGLKIPVNKIYLRQIVFLTDGAVGNEEEILKEIQKILGKARVFTFGIGPSVNRYLLEKMAQLGRGTVQYLTVEQDIEEAIQKFANQTAFPLLCDINLEWKGGRVADVYPSIIPDLYFGQVLSIVGRFYSHGKVTAVFKSRTVEGEFKREFQVELPEKDEEYPVIETIWARKRIESLLDREREKPKEKGDIRDEIIGIAMKYNLMSPYTSLVAVEEIEGEKKEIVTVNVPSMFPEGLNVSSFQSGGGFPREIGSSRFRSMSPHWPSSMASYSFSSSVHDPSHIGVGINFLSGPEKKTLMGGVTGLAENIIGGVVDGVMSIFSSDKKKISKSVIMNKDSEKSIPHMMSFSPSSKVESVKSHIMPKTEFTSHDTEAIFKWLIRNQTADGFFSQEDGLDKKIISTSLALLAFAGYGHTDRTGTYRPQIGKAVKNITDNLDKLSGIALSLSAWLLFELYGISQKKKEKDGGEKALEKLKDLWKSFNGTSECFFAALAVKSAVKSGLLNENLPETDNRISAGLADVKDISYINTMDEFFSSITGLISGNKSSLDFWRKHYVSNGPEKGSFHSDLGEPLGITGAVIFVISWPWSKLKGS